MERIENCEMIKAEIVNGNRLEMKFYDAKNDVLRTVKFNQQNYDREKGQFVDDPEKAQKCEEWSQKYFGCSFSEVPEQVGVSRDIYVYDNFCSLWTDSCTTIINYFVRIPFLNNCIKDGNLLIKGTEWSCNIEWNVKSFSCKSHHK